MKFTSYYTNIDMFGKTIKPNMNGRTTTGTKAGATLTIFFYIGMLVYISLQIQKMCAHTAVNKSF